MKHLTLSEQGSFCKLQGERILVFNKDQMVFEGTLNRLKNHKHRQARRHFDLKSSCCLRNERNTNFHSGLFG